MWASGFILSPQSRWAANISTRVPATEKTSCRSDWRWSRSAVRASGGMKHGVPRMLPTDDIDIRPRVLMCARPRSQMYGREVEVSIYWMESNTFMYFLFWKWNSLRRLLNLMLQVRLGLWLWYGDNLMFLLGLGLRLWYGENSSTSAAFVDRPIIIQGSSPDFYHNYIDANTYTFH